MATPTTVQTPVGASEAVPSALLGRPRWFVTLFVTDMWERFSFYGMLAILFLFASAPASRGGLALTNADAGMLFGAYTAAIFLAALPGGWLGDRVFGTRRATLYGAVVIMVGHLLMAVPTEVTVFAGLLFIAAGTGLLKPNLASLLSAFYPRGATAERDAGFAIFYTSIQVSALVAPLVVGSLGEGVNWHLGFGVAAVGMAFGVWQYVRGSASFGETGRLPERPATAVELRRVGRASAVALAAVVAAFTADAVAGTFTIRHVLLLVTVLSVVVPIRCFRGLLRSPEVSPAARARLRTYIWFFVASALFWGLHVQGGSLLSLFARDSTDRAVLGVRLPASWFQSATPLAILLLAPVFAWLWLRYGRRISAAVKFAVGMTTMGSALLLIALAAEFARSGGRVSPLWLVGTYLLMGAGEAALAPVGMSVAAAVAPTGFLSQLVGVSWLGAGMGAGLGGVALKAAGGNAPGPGLFLLMGALSVAAGLGLLLAARPLARRLGL
ncbi:Proton-dependent oligopeptide transporter POT family protein [Kitasatospora sp. MMS16-BH015]|uniref:peptide MFS transporter n=1 Tax=Kitasatospora sp. MMS16-BH015 TaxID=2018025 RepID=UPI000CA2348D|nr:peptide MFS transporter [Kitasatospora sp. MMS16-BH015]AUG78948.1 Proton-dependent oligopeptide transporter POT family protein [Kitasatospora sp. MMS16-BH015]